MCLSLELIAQSWQKKIIKYKKFHFKDDAL